MRKIAEIRKDLNAKVAEVKALDPKANAEALAEGLRVIDELLAELRAAEAVERAEQAVAEERLANMERKAGRRFSIVRFLEGVTKGNMTGLEAEVAGLGAEEYRRLGLQPQGYVIPSAYLRAATGQGAGLSSNGQALVEGDDTRYVDILKERLVLSQLGATILTDLNGTVPVITSSQVVSGWGEEGAAAAITKTNYAKATMTPHRNFTYMSVSKDLLRQTSFDVEADIMNKIVDAHANLIEAAAINGSGTSSQPKGILATDGVAVVELGTNGAAITWKGVVDLETAVNVNNANRGRMGYLTNSKVNGALKTTVKGTGIPSFILEGGDMLNGYPYAWSNLVPSNLTKGSAASKCSAMICGNFADLYIGQWGGLDICADGNSTANAIKGEIGIVLNAWNDTLVAEPKSFAVIKDILA